MDAYQAAFEHTNTEDAPWHVVPANKKWYARIAVQQLLLERAGRACSWSGPKRTSTSRLERRAGREVLSRDWSSVVAAVAARLPRVDLAGRRPAASGRPPAIPRSAWPGLRPAPRGPVNPQGWPRRPPAWLRRRPAARGLPRSSVPRYPRHRSLCCGGWSRRHGVVLVMSVSPVVLIGGLLGLASCRAVTHWRAGWCRSMRHRTARRRPGRTGRGRGACVGWRTTVPGRARCLRRAGPRRSRGPGSSAATGPGPGPGGGRAGRRPAPQRADRRGGPAQQPFDLLRPARSTMVSGADEDGAGTQGVQAVGLPVHEPANAAAELFPAWRTPASSSATSGTIRLAASVGVEARRSATSSRMGRSASWPMALTTGVTAAATARISSSLLNGRRSSSAPPPRAMTMTSTSGRESSSRSARMIWATAVLPWTATSRISNSTAGHRSAALRRTSFLASESRPVIRPIRWGSSGRGFFRESANRPSAARAWRRRLDPGQQVAQAYRADVPDGHISRPVFSQNSGLSRATTREPRSSGMFWRSRTSVQTDAGREISASTSRSVRIGIAAAAVHFDDLAFDPRRRRPVDMRLEFLGQQLQRPGIVRAGFRGRGGQRAGSGARQGGLFRHARCSGKLWLAAWRSFVRQ